ncbi:hypothetical protein MXB_2589 [Myxobolus squamalis]|nr:hypothetical protein MXB_2589 [Myxobolus squamalis]
MILSHRVSLISYLQQLDALSDCTNGYGLIDQSDSYNLFCVRCSPGKFGLGCQLCTPGFYCQGYSQLQPTGPCPEGYYCLEGTSFGPTMYDDDNFGSLFSLPNLCPPGSYCPAGTATFREDDLTHNNPKLCIEGYYCPAGSTKPTQKACPKNSISPMGSKSLGDCWCKPGFYGDTIESGFCIPCLNKANCSQADSKNDKNKNIMKIPIGYWPNTPENENTLFGWILHFNV